jgi:hypothetical protein
MSKEDQGYKVSVEDDFIHLETWGVPTEKNVAEPVSAAIELAEDEKITKLLDDIRLVNADAISLLVQAKGVGVLWKLRRFKKVAIIISSAEMTWIFTSSLQELGLNLGGWNIRHFSDVGPAKAWLKGDTKASTPSAEAVKT